jgi:hypothetical protein
MQGDCPDYPVPVTKVEGAKEEKIWRKKEHTI